MFPRCSFACVLALLMTPLLLQAERPAAQPGKAGRSVTVANNGIVATSHPLAAQVGLDVLKRGGNAADAAVATSAAMGLMEPCNCGIGGDLYAIVYDAKTQKLYGLNASGRAPGKATLAYFAEKGLKDIPTSGPLSWCVPGCVDGWDQLRQKFGTKSFKELLTPSIDYAESGVPIPEVIAGYWQNAILAKDDDTRSVFLPLSKPDAIPRYPRAGDVFK